MLKHLLQNPTCYISGWLTVWVTALTEGGDDLFAKLNLCRTEQIKKAFLFSRRHHKSQEVNRPKMRKVEGSERLWLCSSWCQNLIYKSLIRAYQSSRNLLSGLTRSHSWLCTMNKFQNTLFYLNLRQLITTLLFEKYDHSHMISWPLRLTPLAVFTTRDQPDFHTGTAHVRGLHPTPPHCPPYPVM